MRLVREEISFTRGKNPKTSMGVGVAVENRDKIKRLENFEAAFPEINVAYNASSHLNAPGEHPKWQLMTAGIMNPKDGISLEDRGEKMLDWLESYTDFDIIEIENSYDRRFMPGLTKDPVEQYEQHYTFRMRNEEDIG